MNNIPLRTIVDLYFDGDRKLASAAANVSIAFFNNWISEERTASRLINGDFVLNTLTMKTFSVPKSQSSQKGTQYDEVMIVNINHHNFIDEDNGHTYQTKDLMCNSSKLCVINGALFLTHGQVNGNEPAIAPLGNAVASDYTGTINIYRLDNRQLAETWIEYALTLNNGKLEDVKLISRRENTNPSVSSDYSRFKSKPYSNRLEVTISAKQCDYAKEIDIAGRITPEALNAIRDALGEKSAVIFHPALSLVKSDCKISSSPTIVTVGDFTHPGDQHDK